MMIDKTIDEKEVSHFAALSGNWWDQNGPFKDLHKLNPVRLQFIKDQVCSLLGRDTKSLNSFAQLKIIDVGCGGGLLSEPLARLGANVVGIDAVKENIDCATAHAIVQGLDIDYRFQTIEDVVETGELFDVVVTLEVVEHVADVELFLKSCARVLKPGGVLCLTTLNRTWKSYAYGIIMAEYVLRWVPKGTHQWSKFIKPSEIMKCLGPCNMRLIALKGMSYSLLKNNWYLSNDIDVNFFLGAQKN